MSEQWKLENGRLSAKVEKVVHIVLYGPTISQSDCRKAGRYPLPLINIYKYLDCYIKPELTGLDDKGRLVLG